MACSRSRPAACRSSTTRREDPHMRRQDGPARPGAGKVSLQILVDRGSIEVFGNDGRVAISHGVIPPEAEPRAYRSRSRETADTDPRARSARAQIGLALGMQPFFGFIVRRPAGRRAYRVAGSVSSIRSGVRTPSASLRPAPCRRESRPTTDGTLG